MDVIVSYTDEKGKPFQLLGNLKELKEWIEYYTNMPDDDEDEGIDSSVLIYEHDVHPTAEQREQDKEKLRDFGRIETTFWLHLLQAASRKKNGTLGKGRVQSVYVSTTFADYYEDSYGWNTPEVRIKNISDDTAHLEFGGYLQKY